MKLNQESVVCTLDTIAELRETEKEYEERKKRSLVELSDILVSPASAAFERGTGLRQSSLKFCGWYAGGRKFVRKRLGLGK